MPSASASPPFEGEAARPANRMAAVPDGVGLAGLSESSTALRECALRGNTFAS